MRHACIKLLIRLLCQVPGHSFKHVSRNTFRLKSFRGREVSGITNCMGILDSNFLEQGEQDLALGIILLNRPLPKLAAHLWDRAALRVCADGGANRLYDELPKLLSHQSPTSVREAYLPNLIAGDMDSIRPAVMAFYQERGVQLVNLSHDQLTTDLTKSILHMEKLRQQQQLPEEFTIVALGGIGGRLDHTLGNLSSLYAHRDTRLVLCGDDNLARLVPKGQSVIRPCRQVEGPHCGLVPYNGPARGTSLGLRWNLEDTHMEVGGLISTCNVIDADEIQVETDGDLLWMAQYNDELFALAN